LVIRPPGSTGDIVLTFLYIAAGGAVGAVARYTVSNALPSESFPLGTLVVNVIGCFLFGLLRMHSHALSAELQTGLAAGFLGALTTFSTFGYDTVHHLERGHLLVAFGNVAANLMLGLLAVWIGLLVGQVIAGPPRS
jgi:fluoride exporter